MSPISASSSDTAAMAERPWLRQYAPGIPASLRLEHHSPLQAFDRCAAQQPDASALWYFNSPMTYRELDRQARQLASAWRHFVERGARVAILNQNTPATLVALIAAWRLGAIAM